MVEAFQTTPWPIPTLFVLTALRTFTTDRQVQVTPGIFLGTFVYALTVMRTVRDAGTPVAVAWPAGDPLEAQGRTLDVDALADAVAQDGDRAGGRGPRPGRGPHRRGPDALGRPRRRAARLIRTAEPYR